MFFFSILFLISVVCTSSNIYTMQTDLARISQAELDEMERECNQAVETAENHWQKLTTSAALSEAEHAAEIAGLIKIAKDYNPVREHLAEKKLTTDIEKTTRRIVYDAMPKEYRKEMDYILKLQK